MQKVPPRHELLGVRRGGTQGLVRAGGSGRDGVRPSRQEGRTRAAQLVRGREQHGLKRGVRTGRRDQALGRQGVCRPADQRPDQRAARERDHDGAHARVCRSSRHSRTRATGSRSRPRRGRRRPCRPPASRSLRATQGYTLAVASFAAHRELQWTCSGLPLGCDQDASRAASSATRRWHKELGYSIQRCASITRRPPADAPPS